MISELRIVRQPLPKGQINGWLFPGPELANSSDWCIYNCLQEMLKGHVGIEMSGSFRNGK